MAKDFNPQNYDPDKWLKAAQDAGFQYAVLTTRHHEGFALWPSAVRRFQHEELHGRARSGEGIRRGLPPKWFEGRAVLFAAGLAFRSRLHELSLRRSAKLNPEFPALDADLKPRTTTHMPEEMKAHQEAFAEEVNGQIEELLTHYGKIDLIWFDGKPNISWFAGKNDPSAGEPALISIEHSPASARHRHQPAPAWAWRFHHLRAQARHEQNRHRLGGALPDVDRLVALHA